MAISKIDISCLFKKSKDCEIGSTTYVVGTSGPKDVDLYPGLRPTRTKSAKYSNSLFLYKAWKENNLFVVTSADNNTIYAEYIDSYSSDAVKEKSFLANKDGYGNWDIKIGEYASPRTLASIISVISCVMEECLTNPDSITPLCFCDTVYYGYIYNNKDAFSYESEPDKTIFSQAQRAYSSGLLTNVICGVNPFNPFDSDEPEGSTFNVKSTCKWVYKSFEKIKEFLCSPEVSAEDIALGLTFRSCAGVIEDIEEGINRKDSLDNFKGIIYSGGDSEIAEKAQSLINSLPGISSGDNKIISDYNYYCEGNGKISYEWTDEQKSKIVNSNFLDEFVPSYVFYRMANKITYRCNKIIERMKSGLSGRDAIDRDFINVRLVGNPGTGKTVMAEALSAALGLPIYTIPIQKNAEEDTFEGKNKIVDGNLTFVNTDFLEAYKNGGIIVLEEINLASPALVMGALGQAIEPPFLINENGYKKVTRHPMCIIIGTQNVNTIGSQGINQAFASRFKQTYIVNDPSEDEFIERLITRFSS